MTMNTLRTAARSNNALVDALRDQMNKRIVGQETFIDSLLLGLFGDGHILLEGAPGLAKTKAVNTLAELIEGEPCRVQFTPDLLPSDLTGTEIISPGKGNLRIPSRSSVSQPDPCRRDQPRTRQGAVGAPGSHGRTPGHRCR